MKNIVISPFSRKLRSGERNAKNYPHWNTLVKTLRNRGDKVVQIGVEDEEEIGAEFFYKSLTLDSLKTLIESFDLWISVDNFMNHFGAWIGKKGIVIFSKSDPNIFGYENNINLLKNKRYLREKQFELWENEAFEQKAFVFPQEVIKAIDNNF